MRIRNASIWIILIAIAGGSCKKDDHEFTFSIADYYRKMSTLTIEVAYETGAAPFTENNSGSNLYNFTKDNIEALFTNHPNTVTVVVPDGLGTMQEIPNQQQDTYTGQDILDIADRYRLGTSTATAGNFFVVFLDGYLLQNGQKQEGVLGAQFKNTQVAAIFKPVVESTNPFTTIQKLVEQNTLVHEIGHGLGLVNNGVPLTSQHHDADNGAHCTNEDCVMYWLNEGAGGATNFVQDFLQNNTIIVFGPECIADAEAYTP